MNRSTFTFEAQLHISPIPAIIVLAAIALALTFVAELQPDSANRESLLDVVLFLLVVSAIAWGLCGWKAWVGRWFTIVALVAAIALTHYWQAVPGILALLAVPTGLAAAVISLSAATITAAGASLLVAVLSNSADAGLDPSSAAVALMAIWAVLAILYAVYRPVRQKSAWLEEYLELARRSREETRDRRAELKQALDDLVHANRQLALMNERATALRLIAEEAQKAKTNFVARVSHEFRTPLNLIIGLVELMVESPEMYDVTMSPRMREDFKIVRRNCEHLSNMVSDVLDLTRIETGRPALHRERVDLGEIVDNALVTVSPLLESKQLALHVSIPEGLPEVYCDRTRIEQVILNLMSNAGRYTEEGEITVKIAQQDQHVLVSVTDTGPGIPPEDVENIFEPFRQVPGDLWRSKGGSGLGLTVSKQFVERHGGRMWLTSELGVGTTFYFELPISPPIGHTSRPGHQIKEDWIWHQRQSRAKFNGSHYGSRLVICDESGDLYTDLARVSDEVEFVDARDLAGITKALQHSPAHAVVLNTTAEDDVRLLVEAAGKAAPGTPIIVCSVPRSVERAISLGALGYLIKPVTSADLKRAIQSIGSPVRRVLVVDDDPEALGLFERLLRLCDPTLEVGTASGGEEALDKLRRAPPDLLLLDVIMPDMDGWQVLESMTQDQGLRRVPCYFVSAQDPADRPLMSRFFLATMDEGLSLSKLLRCSLELSKLMLSHEEELDPVPV